MAAERIRLRIVFNVSEPGALGLPGRSAEAILLSAGRILVFPADKACLQESEEKNEGKSGYCSGLFGGGKDDAD